METIKVFWKDKFDGKAVTINADDFDPAIHRTDQPWGVSAETAGESPNAPKAEGGSKSKGKAEK